MPDVNRGNRPLSPHLQVYRPQLHSAMSIFHRITGVGLTLGALLAVWWFMAAATGPDAFALANGFMSSWIGILIMVLSLLALAYHFCNGVRHLWWDTGNGFGKEDITKSAYVVLGASAILFVLILLLA